MIEISYVDTLWVLIASSLVFIMHLGFATLESGFTRSKNTVSIIMKNLSTVIVGSLVFFIIGFSIAFSGDGALIGGVNLAFMNGITSAPWGDLALPSNVFFLFQMMFAATAATIVSGAVAERIKFTAYLVICALLVAFIYPTIAHWIWGGGWLAERGFLDFAGSTVVHSVGGWAALASAFVLGPRIGKFSHDGKPLAIAGHDIGLATIGLFLLWVGWFGFNAGSELAVNEMLGTIATTTYLSAVGGGFSALLLTWKRNGKPDTGMTMNGILAGLVAITAPCAFVTPLWAMLIGLVAGVIVVYAVDIIESRFKIDDPVGAISVHGINGLWGTLAVGLFASESGLLTTGSVSQLATQALGAGATFLLVFPLSLIIAYGIDKSMGLRVSETIELRGLDTTEFGADAYPEFVRE
ncbi:ammonium transporter [archaeon]|nr:MAG: ammonium transporter [archaeon]